MTTHRTPMNPMTKNGVRQPEEEAIGITINGAMAAPVEEPIVSHEIPLDVSVIGNHRDMAAEPFGNAPASPAPNKNRAQIREKKPVVTPVSAVNKDHQSTMRMNTARCPIRSPSTPDGISKMA